MVDALSGGAVSFRLEGADFLWTPFIVFFLLGVCIIVPSAFFRRWYFYRRRLKKQVITAEYEPPLELNPAEIGYLFDGKLRESEVAATIIHLIQRGYLHLKKTEHGKRIFAGPRVGADMKSYEKKLIEEADVDEGVSATDLLKRFTSLRTKDVEMTAASKSFVFTQLVHSDLLRRHYVKDGATRSFLFGVFKIMVVMQAALLYLPLIGLWVISVFSTGAADFKALGILVLMGLLVSTIFSMPILCSAIFLNIVRGRIVGREWIITEKLERLWPQIVGYRQYVQLVEREKLEFQTEELKKISKNDTLPYAVALGFVKNWHDLLS